MANSMFGACVEDGMTLVLITSRPAKMIIAAESIINLEVIPVMSKATNNWSIMA
jgi:hypothetical protein